MADRKSLSGAHRLVREKTSSRVQATSIGHGEATHSFDLFVTGTELTGARAHVVIQYCSKDDRGTTCITGDCATQEEWDWQIDRLQQELELVRQKGRRRLNAALHNKYKTK